MLPETKAGIRRAIPLIVEMEDVVRDRGKRAETRAAILLGSTGVLTGLVIDFSNELSNPNMAGWWLLSGLFVATLILLVKSAMYGLKALDALKGFELSPEAGIELCGKSEEDAQRTELAARIWEYYQLLRSTNARLYFSQRSQRNLVLGIITWAVAAVAATVISFSLLSPPILLEFALALLSILVALAGDASLERISKMWNWSSRTG